MLVYRFFGTQVRWDRCADRGNLCSHQGNCHVVVASAGSSAVAGMGFALRKRTNGEPLGRWEPFYLKEVNQVASAA